MWLLLTIAGLVVAFLLIVFVIAISERLYLKDQMAPAAQPFPCRPQPYWLETREEARRAGLRPGGDFVAKKGLIKGLQSLWLTPDGVVLVAIEAAGGVRKTVLRTRLADGRIMESSDNPGLSDVSGTIDRAVLINAGLSELMDFHRQRIATAGSPPSPFTGESLLAENEQVETERGRRMVELGLARWADPQQSSIRMTLRGAMQHIGTDYFKQMAELKKQSNRSHLRRAGS
jgi:hypothetical protein